MSKIKSYGKVAITINGEFDPDKSYDRLCIVEYNGLDYISIIDNTTQPPTDKTQWKLLSKKGDNGINGKDGKDGNAGATGIPGVAFEVRYCLGTENSYDGDSNPDGSSPTGWLTFIPNVTDEKPYIWCIQGRKVYINQTDYNISWNNPFKLSGTNGLNGINGKDGLNGADGVNGKDGTGIIWKGDLNSHPSNPQNGWSYKNTIDKKSYIYQDGAWYQMTIDGVDGKDGKDGTSISIAGSLNSESELPIPPTNSSDCYIIGQDIYIWDGASWYNGGQFKGDNGVSIIWKGRFNSHPSGPQAGWAYYNITEKKSYIYDGTEWDIMTYDGIDGSNGENGKDGQDGLSIIWKGDLPIPPENPQLNWCYRDTDNKKVYIYNGVAWELMVTDGNDGAAGAPGKDGQDGAPGVNGENGKDGLSVFITYHDNPIGSVPSKPTGDGTTGGWHTNGTSAVNWMSQKVAETATSGEWSEPIRISPIDGEKGEKGDKAPIVYPAGIFDPSVVYITDANKAPYVLDSSDGNYYVLTSIGSWVGNNQTEDKNTPSKDFLINKGTCWNKFDGFEAIFAKIGIIANGLIGSAVFNGTFMFSQQGTTTLEGATITTDYENFNPENPFGENNVFYPNICFNFATGETWLGKNKFSINERGIITIGGFEIGNNGMTYFDEENNTLLRIDRNLGFQIANAYNGLPIAQISPTGKGVFSNRNINFLPDGSINIKTNNGKNVFVINSDGSGKIGETVIEWDESNVWIGNKSLSVLDDGAIIDNKTKFIDITNFLTNNVFISNVESVNLNVDVENYETIVLYSTRYFSSNIIYYASTINVILNNILGEVDNRKINILINGFTSKSINTYIKFNNIYQYLFGKGPNGTNTIAESFTTEYNIKKEYILKTAADFITNAPTTLFAILV